eukprot:Colp12_sorted_trinity150504_noHs@32557
MLSRKDAIWKAVLGCCLLLSPLAAGHPVDAVKTISPTEGFQPCVVQCQAPEPEKTGCDIAQDVSKYPDPFAWYTNPDHPGVTLPGPAKKSCPPFSWNTNEQTCFLNGQGYPLDDAKRCANQQYSISAEDFQAKLDYWHSIRETTKTTQVDGNTVYLAQIQDVGEVAISVGHGVLGGKCGDCFLLKYQDKFVAQLQTDVRAWSLELSSGTNIYLAQGNYGGGCMIPEVKQIPCEAVVALTA